jgi:hypothetical protein
MKIDKQEFIASLGGPSAVDSMNPEAQADAIEDFMMKRLNEEKFGLALKGLNEPGIALDASGRYPTMAEIEEQIETRAHRRGVGNLFLSHTGNVTKLPPMPARPTLVDYFKRRFTFTGNHVLQSANLARKNGLSEEIILACLLHDTVQELIKVDHGWWSAQLYELYVPEKVAFAIRYHQALRFYEDKQYGYEYPEIYRMFFGEDYKPEPYIEAAYQMVRNHKWYFETRMVTVNDLYSFEPGVNPQLEDFIDIIGRHFKQPKEGLGFDNSPVAHMWRSIANPDRPL